MGNDPFKPNKMTLLTILLSSMVILMGAAVVAPALKPISEAFPDASSYMVSLVITLPALSVALTGFGVGYLADRFGKAKVFFISLAIFTLAGVSGYLTDSFELMLAGRFILGIGITGISLTTTALIGEYWSGMDRAKVIGYQSAAIGVGTLFLETAGGALADIGWQEPFLVYLIGIPIILLGLASIREPRKEAVRNETIQVETIANRGRKIMFCYLVVFLEMFLMFSLPTNFSYYISEIGGNLTMCGLLLGVMGVAQAVFSLIYTRRSNKLSDNMAYAFSFLMMGIGLAILFIPNMVATMVSMVIVGFSLGLLMPTVIGQLSRYAQAHTSGKVMGGYSVSLNLSMFISGLAVTSLVGFTSSYQRTYLILGIVSIVACVLCAVTGMASRRKDRSDKGIVHEHIPSQEVQMYESILVPTDGSENNRIAVDKAMNIARKNGSSVTALFVIDTERYAGIAAYTAEEINEIGISLANEALAYVKEKADEHGIPMTSKIEYGHPADRIVEESIFHDLVVCGSLGRTKISRAMMGSVAEKVVRTAHCPVLIVRKNMNR